MIPNFDIKRKIRWEYPLTISGPVKGHVNHLFFNVKWDLVFVKK